MRLHFFYQVCIMCSLRLHLTMLSTLKIVAMETYINLISLKTKKIKTIREIYDLSDK